MHAGMCIIINDILANQDNPYIEGIKEEMMDFFREIYPIEFYDMLEKTVEELDFS